MLVRFDSKSGTITMFGDVAVKLLRMMGQTGAVPGALLASDIPAAAQRLKTALATTKEPAGGEKTRSEEGEPPVAMRQRAFPLIELLERAAKKGEDVIWEEERRTVV
jgi:hypothetical protein